MSVESNTRGPDYTNPFDLVRRATDAVRDNTGTLEAPGDYVRFQGSITPAKIDVLMGWENTTPTQPIAGFLADQVSDETGRMLVALVGSISNFIGGPPEQLSDAWRPSDVRGLYELLHAAREPSDPPILSGYLADEEGLDEAARCDPVINLIHHLAGTFPTDYLEVLAQRFYLVHDEMYLGEKYDAVLVGTPIWVATPQPIEVALPER